jgi:hypothetical protein
VANVLATASISALLKLRVTGSCDVLAALLDLGVVFLPGVTAGAKAQWLANNRGTSKRQAIKLFC